MSKIQPLDFVRTPEGAIAFVIEGTQKHLSIDYFGGGNPTGEKNAWWDGDELEYLDNLPSLLARNLPHPFTDGDKESLEIFPLKRGEK